MNLNFKRYNKSIVIKNPLRLFIAIYIPLFIFSSCKSTQKNDALSEIQNTNALLWEISVDGQSQPSYIYGTIHMIDAEDYFLPDGTLGAIDNAQKMVFEIDMNEMTDMSKIMSIMNKVMMNGDTSLSDLLPKEDYTLVENYFNEMGLPFMFFKKMKPMFLTAMTYGDGGVSGFQNGGIKSYELEFFDIAKDKNMQVGGLETMEFQLSLFDQIPYKAQAKMLVDAIKNSKEGSDELEKMTELYKAQNIIEMASSIQEEGADIANFEDELVVKRNKNWVPLIISTSKSMPVFYAVGAGHLGGVNGVLQLLANEGVKVRPVLAKKSL
ncbi:MAG TPA: TraB/GumN family protein [Saprospiraceae bacterium]|nr:TraB/GumN family protein [Saprospiraceae bacterium]HPK09291.1 TraB/GumN family protein [Saprospiraceae bacterium]HRX28502.1 TraB/GumN family protein [Saprospiraceae bacterium]